MSETQTCDVRIVEAPDGADVPVPSGGLGLPNGKAVNIRPDADVQVSINSGQGYYIAINNADPSNDEAAHLFGEIVSEAGLNEIEYLAVAAFGAAAETPVAIGAFLVGQLVSLLTPSELTQEVFIRGTMSDGTRATYCILI